jgi:hypothetical protein
MAPHTGCTAIGLALQQRLGGTFIPENDILDGDGVVRIARKHTQLHQLLEGGILTREERAGLVVATAIRNPFDALVSKYVQATDTTRPYRSDPRLLARDRRRGAVPHDQRVIGEFEPWLRDRFRPRLLARLRGHRYNPPTDWTAGADVVLRYERLQADFDALMTRVGVTEHIEIPRHNRTRPRASRPYQAYYTPEARRLVEQVYADRLAEYGYRFEPLPRGPEPVTAPDPGNPRSTSSTSIG